MRSSWERVARSEDVTGPGFVRAEANGRPVLLTRLSDGSVVAFGTICPHQGLALDEGTLWEDEVDCPHHHYTYDPRTGENRFPKQVVPARKARSVPGIPAFAAKEDGGWVYVEAHHGGGHRLSSSEDRRHRGPGARNNLD